MGYLTHCICVNRTARNESYCLLTRFLITNSKTYLRNVVLLKFVLRNIGMIQLTIWMSIMTSFILNLSYRWHATHWSGSFETSAVDFVSINMCLKQFFANSPLIMDTQIIQQLLLILSGVPVNQLYCTIRCFPLDYSSSRISLGGSANHSLTLTFKVKYCNRV